MAIEFRNGIRENLFQLKKYTLFINSKYMPNSNEVIIFIHGLACSSDSFRNVFDYDYFPTRSLLFIDLIGFGKSSKPDDFSYSIVDQAQLISELITNLQQKKIHIVAHSMGGAVALLLPDEILNRVVSLSNVEGNLIGEDCGLFSRGVISTPFEKYETELFIRQKEENKNHPQFRFEETTPHAIYKSAESLVKWSDSGELLKIFQKLSCRKSYFFGEENINMPVLNRLDSIEKIEIRNSGHAMMTENPEEFYSKLVDFIDRKLL